MFRQKRKTAGAVQRHVSLIILEHFVCDKFPETARKLLRSRSIRVVPTRDCRSLSPRRLRRIHRATFDRSHTHPSTLESINYLRLPDDNVVTEIESCRRDKPRARFWYVRRCRFKSRNLSASTFFIFFTEHVRVERIKHDRI